MSFERPRILIAPQTEQTTGSSPRLLSTLSEDYSNAIVAAQGIPFIAPATTDRAAVRGMVASMDGVLLTGGDDVDPKLYAPRMSAQLKKTMKLDGPQRDSFELLLIQEVFAQRKPVLAICRGMQILNISLGGDLIADIPLQIRDAIQHRRNDAKEEKVHNVSLTRGSTLARVVGRKTLGVNSTHHQAVGRMAKVFVPNAVSRDGIVEGLELSSAHTDVLPYLLAVQFHPERLWARYPEHLAIFQSFTMACQRNRQRDV